MKITQQLLFSTVIVMTSLSCISQDFGTTSFVSASGYLSAEEELPFWLLTNKNGAVASQTDGLFQGGTKATYAYSEKNNATLTAGVSVFIRNGVADKLQRNEIYLQFENSWVRALVGAKNPTDRFQGLSVVNDNFLLSGNARAIPGVLLETAQPISVFKNVAIEASIGHYELNDDRDTKGTMLHYKKFYANWQLNSKNQLRLGIEHYAQWGGTSPEFGKFSDSFSDFINVFFAQNAGEGNIQGEQVNALGNHLGLYNLEYTYTPSLGQFKFYHQHPFEDGSGSALKNFPDGIWGIYFKPNEKKYTGFFKGMLIEYVQTVSQSGRFGRSGRDNYFNNRGYRTGWRYDTNFIGFPFFDNTPIDQIIENNRVLGVHMGLLGGFKAWTWLAKISITENLGRYGVPIVPKEKRVYTYLKTTYTFKKVGIFSLEVGYDYNNQQQDKVGAGLTYRYIF